MWLLWTTALARDCDPARLTVALEAAEAAYASRDAAGAARAVQHADTSLCATAPPTSHARLHRARALAAVLRDDREAAAEHLQAAVVAFPLLPIREPLDRDPILARLWLQAQEVPMRWESRGVRQVNGLSTPVRRQGGSTRSKLPLVVTGLAIGAAGAGLYGSAFQTRSAYELQVSQRDEKRIRNLHTTTNALTLTGIGVAAAGGAVVVFGLTR